MSDRKLDQKKSTRFNLPDEKSTTKKKKKKNKERSMSFKELQAYLKEQNKKKSRKLLKKQQSLKNVDKKTVKTWVGALIDRFIDNGTIKDESISDESPEEQRKALREVLDPDNKLNELDFTKKLRDEFVAGLTEDELYTEQSALIQDLAAKLDGGNLVIINDKHNQEEPFLYASLLMDRAEQPGTLMIEGPLTLNEWDDAEFDTKIDEWSRTAWNNLYQAEVVKKARELGWKVVSVDMMSERDPNNHKINKHSSRQKYIGGMIKSVMDSPQNPHGKVLVIGTGHIAGNEFFSGGLDKWANRTVEKDPRLDDIDRAQVWVMNKDESKPQNPKYNVNMEVHRQKTLDELYIVIDTNIDEQVDAMIKGKDQTNPSNTPNKKTVTIHSRRLFNKLKALQEDEGSVAYFTDSANKTWRSEYSYAPFAKLNEQRTYTLTDVTNEKLSFYYPPSEDEPSDTIQTSIDSQPNASEQVSTDQSPLLNLDTVQSIATFYNQQKNLVDSSNRTSLETFISTATEINERTIQLRGNQTNDSQAQASLDDLIVSIALDISKARQDLKSLPNQ
ncbi:hypothetical protein [Microscilla marina]|uniref:Uncharacterized protein n=1 Tax=Microscilla marina ATCC 23134 TaxID=313606 RepID=A1ZTU2_MICM2|nr:hypothetical protein [Microscilla marina]EAY26194.1 hypothetical protein M23134_02526 [Microscilla marina ATCC 23134]